MFVSVSWFCHSQSWGQTTKHSTLAPNMMLIYVLTVFSINYLGSFYIFSLTNKTGQINNVVISYFQNKTLIFSYGIVL